ncbi:winged helix-turn-helix domain-containing protein [Roseomonas sp. 18066]|uniref:ATP-binding protein n=1 Tax=Roseomonas sp. 18066 TaxID=2681412 RepID=UPI0013572AD6|nr:winged helix-turn-helix domain-containing protein [Roseomonas sp. 18066]
MAQGRQGAGAAGESHALRFGGFTLWPARHLLTQDGDGQDGDEQAVPLGSRALALLVALTRQPGEMVDKRQLMAEVWPGQQVDESNLRAQVATLRRALAQDPALARAILSIAGRGYCFVAPVRSDAGAVPAPAAEPRPLPPPPARLAPVVGQEATIAALAAELARRRLVTLTGSGGIGKTTLAIAVAQASGLPVCFIDLGSLADPARLPSRLAAALELGGGGDLLVSVAAALQARPALLLLDSCEAVIDATAAAAEALLRQAPGLRILATSREPLRVEGEWSYRLPSLSVPPQGGARDAAALLAFPAAQLFLQRMQAAGARAPLRDAEAPALADICRRLDGIPLALELAAGRAAQLGIEGLAERLDESFALLMQGRRTALPRHQTLRATLDWSHRLLAPAEQGFLARLAIFKGPFSLEAALALDARCRGLTPEAARRGEAETVGRLADLVEKSFILAEPGPAGMRYRCLDVTRAYLLGRLAEDGSLPRLAACHASWLLDLLEAAAPLWESRPPVELRRLLAPHLDNLRAALDWSLGEGAAEPGAVGTGLALSVAAAPLWALLGLVEESRRRLELALAALAGAPETPPRLAMRLHAAFGTTALLMGDVPAQARGWQGTLALAGQLDDQEHRLRALNGLTVVAMDQDFRAALAMAERFRAEAATAPDPNDAAMADRLVGYVLHNLGEQAEARRLTERMLARYTRRPVASHLGRMNYFDQRILSTSTLAQILWLQGQPDRALALANAAVEDALTLDHPFSLGFAVFYAALPVALLCGGLRHAAPALALVQDRLGQHAVWQPRREIFAGLEAIRAAGEEGGSAAEGVARLAAALAGMSPTAIALRSGQIRGGLAEGLSLTGRHAEARGEIDAILERTRGNHDHWYEPELLRLRADIRARAGEAPGLIAADLAEGLLLARRQQVPGWELRLATSIFFHFAEGALPPVLAELAPEGAAALLRQALRAIEGGAATADHRRATLLLGGTRKTLTAIADDRA